jgi:hypothetical protein
VVEKLEEEMEARCGIYNLLKAISLAGLRRYTISIPMGARWTLLVGKKPLLVDL